MLVKERSNEDYLNVAFAIKCLETGIAKELRNEGRLTLRQLGERIGVPENYVWGWERGSRKPNLQSHVITALANYGRELRAIIEQRSVVSDEMKKLIEDLSDF